MSSLFSKLYKYRQSELKNQKENYITEILTYCLENDQHFQNKFLDKIGVKNVSNGLKCNTQHLEPEFGKPDILIEIGKKAIVFIECKVDAKQEKTQLSRYSNALFEKNHANKHLVFLTKFFEETEKQPNEIKFEHLRWFEIFELIKDSNNPVCQEFSKYLIEQKMSTEITFNKSDLNVLKNTSELVSKMDDFLIHLKEQLKKYSEAKVIESKNILIGHYGVLIKVEIGEIWLGFYQYEHNDELQICIDFRFEKSASQKREIDKFLKLNSWETYEEDEFTVWHNSKSISTFFVNDKFDFIEAKSFIENELLKIKKWI